MQNIAARIAVGVIYGAVLSMCSVASVIRRLVSPRTDVQAKADGYDVVCLGTFYNEGWLTAHALPLTLCPEVRRTIVVTDKPFKTMAGVEYHVPNQTLQKVLGKSLCRLISAIQLGFRLKQPILMGYHIMPNGLIALLAGTITGAPCIYQMTGGIAQIAGGGYQSENRLLRLLGTPSPLLDRWLGRILRRMNMIIVRGAKGEAYVKQTTGNHNCHILTGSVDPAVFKPGRSTEKDIDLLYVGRLAEVKGADRFIHLVKAMKDQGWPLNAVLVGDGSERSELVALANRLELDGLVSFAGAEKDVSPYLRRAKLFVLLSKSEGMSIAMLEAMMAGVPVAVSDVGELAHFARDGCTGLLFKETDSRQIADSISSVFAQPERLASMGKAAHAVAIESVSPKAVANSWSRILATLSSA